MENYILAIGKQSLYLILILSGPPVLVALVVGLMISLVQATTQVQEQTLTFVPKIVTIMLVLGVAAPFVGAQISLFSNLVFSRFQSGF